MVQQQGGGPRRPGAMTQAMAAAKAEIEAGGAVAEALEAVRAKLVAAGFQQPDYVALCGAEDLQDMTVLDRPARTSRNRR